MRGFVDYAALNRFILALHDTKSLELAAPGLDFALYWLFLTALSPRYLVTGPKLAAVFPRKTLLLHGKANPFVMGNATFSLNGFFWKKRCGFKNKHRHCELPMLDWKAGLWL